MFPHLCPPFRPVRPAHVLPIALAALAAGLVLAGPAAAGDSTVAGTAVATAPAATWIAVHAPLAGDDDQDGHSTFELATSAAGPWSSAAAIWGALGGPGEWRHDQLARGMVSPGTSYFVRVTYHDPDGVAGPNPQVLGPIATPAAIQNATTVGAATAEAREEEIFVQVPISGDADFDSHGTIEVATSAAGPWTRECGGGPGSNLPQHPKLCRIRSLVPGTDYWVRATIGDGDGVGGANPQVLGPIRYDGLANLAFGRPISADPGWGCCPSPGQLVDGRIQNDAWFYGFAWTGGTSCWAGGCPPGFKQATIDLGVPTAFDRAAVWYHDAGNVPTSWKLQASHDGATFFDLHVETAPVCRTATQHLPGYWGHPACGHRADFPEVTARWFRYAFDDRTLFSGLHGWAVEIELFDAQGNLPPEALCVDLVVEVDEVCLAHVTPQQIDAGSFDPDGFVASLELSPASPYPLGATAVTLEVTDDQGASATCGATVTAVDLAAPAVACNAPPTMVPPDAPLAATATAADACSAPVPVIGDVECFAFGGGGKRIDKSESCVVEVDGATLVVHDSGGVGTTIAWTATATDDAGNAATESCSIEVVRPGQGPQ